MMSEEGFWPLHLAPDELAPDRLVPLTVAGQPFLLTLVEGQAVAYHATCPHGQANLAKGYRRGHAVICPDHGWRFDLRTGAGCWPEEAPALRRAALRLDGGQLWLKPPTG